MNPKPVIIVTCCAIAFVAAVYFGGSHYLKQGRIETPTPAVEQKQQPTAKDTGTAMYGMRTTHTKHQIKPLQLDRNKN